MGVLGGLILKRVSAFSAEAQAVINLMTGLTDDEQNFIATFVDAEVLNGNWGSNYDNFMCFGLISEANALTYWRGIKTATNNGATKTANGFSFDGISDWINSNWIPSVDGVKFTLDDALCGAFVYDAVSLQANDFVLATWDTPKTSSVAILHDSGGNTRWSINDVTYSDTITSALVDTSSYLVTRNASNAMALYKDGSIVDTETDVSVSLGDFNIAIAAGNFDGVISNFGRCTLSSFIVGAQIGFDHSGFNTNLNTLLTSLGVIP